MRKIYQVKVSRQSVRFVLWGMFVLFFLTVCIPLLFFYYLFDANKVKQMVISQFNNKNYAVIINGTVEPRSWHGLSLFISDLTVQDDAHHEALHINTANCQLSWLDLIVGHYKVRRIALNGVTFFQPEDKSSKYADLLDYDSIAHSEFGNLQTLSITNLNWVESQEQYIIRDASMSLTGIETKPLVQLNFKSGRYNTDFSIRGNISKADTDNLNIEQLSTTMDAPKMHVELQSVGHYDYINQKLWVEDTNGVISSEKYNGNLHMDTILLSMYGLTVHDLGMTLTAGLKNGSQSLVLNSLNLRTNNYSDFSIDNSKIKYNAQNSLRKVNLELGLVATKIDSKFNVANKRCDLGLSVVPNQANATVLSSSLSGTCNYHESDNWVGVQLRGLIDGASAKIDAEYAVNNDKDFLKLNGTINALNLSRFMSSAQGSLPLYSDDSLLPFNWLNWLDLEANLKINNLDLSHIHLTNVDSALSVKDKTLKLTRLHANLYDNGVIDGTAVIKADHDAYNISIDNQVSSVDLKKMFINLFDVSAINGLADFTFNTQVNNARTYQDLRKSLDGKVGLKVRNGGFSGVDFSLFLSPENLAAFQSKSQLMTKFSTLNATFEFESGISKNSSINFSSPSILATGNGIIDFAATKINYRLNVSSIMPLNEQHIKSVSIPVGIDGNLFSPQISIQNMTLNTVEPKVTKSRKHR